MNKHHKEERTLVVIKPDGVQRALVGEIMKRYERTGLKLIGIKMMKVTESFIERHYTFDPDWIRKAGEKSINNIKEKGLVPDIDDPDKAGKVILQTLKSYLTSGPLIAMVWQGAHAVEIVRKITGGTEPVSSPIGSIRGDYVVDSYEMSGSDGRSIRNLVHASSSPQEAEQEIEHWFRDGEIVDYTHHQEKILYDKDIQGIF